MVWTYARILDFSFGFGSFSGQTWPQDPFKLPGLEKWCRTHLKSARRPILMPFRSGFLYDHQNYNLYLSFLIEVLLSFDSSFKAPKRHINEW